MHELSEYPTHDKSIGEIIRNGILFDVKNDIKGININDIPESVNLLFSLLKSRNIDFVIVGGLALFGLIKGRNTQNIDFILSRDELISMPEITVKEENQYFARGTFKNIKIPIFLTNNQLFNLVREQYSQIISFRESNVKCATVSGLIILKLYAIPDLYRQDIFNRAFLYESDIQQLLLKYSVDFDEIFAVLSPYLISSDLIELKNIVIDLKRHIERRKKLANYVDGTYKY